MRRCVFIAAILLASQPSSSQQLIPGAAIGVEKQRNDGYQWHHQNLTQDEINRLSDYLNTWKQTRLTKDDKDRGKTIEDLMKEDTANASALANAMQLKCGVVQGVLVARGPETVNGREVDTNTYEVVCGNGMGYFLVSQDPEKAYGFSCFAAEAAREADVAQHRNPGTVCGLSADVKKIAANVLGNAGNKCAVSGWRSVGISSATNTEFTEVACSNGEGYILKTAAPGSSAPVGVISCHDAAMQGLPCKLTPDALALKESGLK